MGAIHVVLVIVLVVKRRDVNIENIKKDVVALALALVQMIVNLSAVNVNKLSVVVRRSAASVRRANVVVLNTVVHFV